MFRMPDCNIIQILEHVDTKIQIETYQHHLFGMIRNSQQSFSWSTNWFGNVMILMLWNNSSYCTKIIPNCD